METTIQALTDFLDALSDEYKRLLIDDGKPATGRLISSITPKVEQEATKFIASFILAEHWKYVEYGRKPGKFPPPNAILSWVQQKPILPRQNEKITDNQLAYLIGRKIANEGIEPGLQLETALKNIWPTWEKNIEDALSKDLEYELYLITLQL